MIAARRSFFAGFVSVAAIVASGAGCGTCRSTDGGAASDAASDALLEGAVVADGGDLPARCKSTTAEAELPGGDTFEAGGAIVTGDRLAVAGSYVVDAVRKGVVVVSDVSLTKVERIELGDLGGGDLAPHLATCTGCGLPVVAAYAPSPQGKSLGTKGGTAKDAPQRVLLVSSLEGNRATLLVKVPQQGDESAAFDLLLGAKDAGLVAWDEDSDRVVRGVVKIASFSQGKLGETVVATPYETDADGPKLVRTEKGDVFLAFLAREAFGNDGGVLADADKEGAYLEAPGEERAHQWVEAVALDPSGKPRGAPFAVTPRGRGFASSFELVAAGEGFDVLVVDGAVERDGAGSRLVRVPVRAGKPASATTLAGGVAGAAAVFGKLVTFVDPSERTMLVALDPPHGVTREPLAGGGRFVAEVGGGFVSAQIAAGDGGPSRAFLKRHACP